MSFKFFCHSAEEYAQIMGIDMEEFHETFGKTAKWVAVVEMVDSQGFQIGKLISKYRGPKTYPELVHQLITEYL